MDKKIWISFVIVAMSILGGTAIYKNNQEPPTNVYTREDAIKDEITRPLETLNVKHQYRNGNHIFVGTLELPTPCHTYNTQVDTTESATEIKIKTAPSDNMCAQVITEKIFKVSFDAEEDELAVFSINGELVNLNIFEIPNEEDINDIEVFIKG